MAKAEITLRIEVDAGFDELKSIAEDIGELVEMIPEYQHYEAEKITNRISSHFKNLINFKDRRDERGKQI